MSQHGLFHSWRVKWLGESDPVADQLRDIARQGSSMARLAHVCAFLLIILFSAGSLVALGGDALDSILREWRSGVVDVPSAISVGVSTLMVLAMDVGMVYAASMLRLLNSRGADQREKRVHTAVIIVVTVLEASTYAYMSWRYEHPAALAAWGLIMARALAAPLLSVYLSMARPLPVTSRDILYQAELAAGQGVIRDVVEVASDQHAPLAEKMSLYGAAATMSAQDRARLDGMISAVELRSERPQMALAAAPIVDADPAHDRDPDQPRTLRVVTQPRRRNRSSKRQGVRTPTVEDRARAAWRSEMSVAELQREASISRGSAQKYHAMLSAEREAQQLAI